jgi:hypothetical protein
MLDSSAVGDAFGQEMTGKAAIVWMVGDTGRHRVSVYRVALAVCTFVRAALCAVDFCSCFRRDECRAGITFNYSR